MASAAAPTQARPASNKELSGSRSATLSSYIYDTTSVQERLLWRTAASMGSVETAEQSAANKLAEIECNDNNDDDHIRDLDNIMKSSSCLRSML
ncbi:hypothetical protein FHETE_5704 [Fusarium heterosporum]|uniref:Uncharacterized protein n=1 Tax=Fusarium heterosporum TaxID=42747 RepID=A0A8H5TAL3_FUSHE|nr:hypothetical protein FHETE_5704 [Fusarium heterosporum]